MLRAIGSAPNLSDIVVSLVTSEGIVQEQTECSPQGYFFIPVYDIVIKYRAYLRGRETIPFPSPRRMVGMYLLILILFFSFLL